MSETKGLLERAVEGYAPEPETALAETMRRARRRQRRRRASGLGGALVAVAVAVSTLVLFLGPGGAHRPASSPTPRPNQAASSTTPNPTERRATDIPPGFAAQKAVTSSPSKLVLEAPVGTIRWTLNGVSCSVDFRWLVVPAGGNLAGGGGRGAACPRTAHLSVWVNNSFGGGGNRAFLSVVGGHVHPATGVQVRVTLADGSKISIQPRDSLWLAVVQRCGDYQGTQITSVELRDKRGSVIDETAIEPEPTPPPNPSLPPWPPC